MIQSETNALNALKDSRMREALIQRMEPIRRYETAQIGRVLPVILRPGRQSSCF